MVTHLPDRDKMNKTVKTSMTAVAFAVTLLAVAFTFGAIHVYQFQKLYGEAEPLVDPVWRLANEVKMFSEKNGKLPETLEELDNFSEQDFSSLKKYHPKFMGSGARIFTMRVNEKYGFYISKDYNPQWISDYSKE